jgi:hypothetical protein
MGSCKGQNIFGAIAAPVLGQEIDIITASRFLNYSVESSTFQLHIYLNLFYPQKFQTLRDIKMAMNGTNGERNKELEDIGVHLSQIKSSGAVTISPELFEKVMLLAFQPLPP